jgi:hypothetical protein
MALLRELLADCGADAADTTGDQCDFPVHGAAFLVATGRGDRPAKKKPQG